MRIYGKAHKRMIASLHVLLKLGRFERHSPSSFFSSSYTTTFPFLSRKLDWSEVLRAGATDRSRITLFLDNAAKCPIWRLSICRCSFSANAMSMIGSNSARRITIAASVYLTRIRLFDLKIAC